MRSPSMQVTGERPTALEDPRQRPEKGLTLSVVIPCLNEAENIEQCVDRSRAVLARPGSTAR